jgi:hypothetical protein
MDEFHKLLSRYASGLGATTHQEAYDHFDQIAQWVPTHVLASVMGPALASFTSQQVRQRLYSSTIEMNAEQRSLLFQLLLNEYLTSGDNLSPLFYRLGINPSAVEHPQQAYPEEIARLVAHAHQAHPDIFDRAMTFYAAHPALVRGLGMMAITAIARKLAEYYSIPLAQHGGQAWRDTQAYEEG